MIDFEGVYQEWINHKNEENRLERYEGNERWYGASSSGSCRRKLYYKCVEHAKPTNPIDNESFRKMRLGTIFHDDMEKALKLYNTKEDRAVKFHYEEELQMPDYNVRGFFDCVMECEDGSIHLYDFKTTNSNSWRYKIGTKTRPITKEDPRYSMQLGMYAVGIEQKFKRIDSMGLVYYNKDTSAMKTIDVPLYWMDRAKEWWKQTNELHAKGLPPLSPGDSPSESWECNYCEWKDHCLGGPYGF